MLQSFHILFKIASYLLVKTYNINKGLEKIKILKPDFLLNAILQNLIGNLTNNALNSKVIIRIIEINVQ